VQINIKFSALHIRLYETKKKQEFYVYLPPIISFVNKSTSMSLLSSVKIKIKLLKIIILTLIFISTQTGLQAANIVKNPLQIAQAKKTWQCGKNLTATLEGTTLTISGEGRMGNFGTWGENTPWEQHRGSIRNVILNGVTNIAAWAFADFRNLHSITIPKGITSIGSHSFSKCSALTSIIIPNSVVTIEASAFSNCTNLSTIKLHYNLTTIGDYAFGNCFALPTIVIPGSVTELGKAIFTGCRTLHTITIYCSQPPRIKGDGVFEKNDPKYTSCTLFVPRGTVETYKKAEGWKEFKNISEMQ